jgi:PIN domain nuclease of toxin-antitoxin system
VSFLLDTHVWIWTQEQPDAIGTKVRALLEKTSDELCVSPVSALEIARLVSGGLLELKGRLDRWIRTAIDTIEARSIDVDHRIARIHDLTLVTADERILAYRAVRTLDARR